MTPKQIAALRSTFRDLSDELYQIREALGSKLSEINALLEDLDDEDFDVINDEASPDFIDVCDALEAIADDGEDAKELLANYARDYAA